MVLKTLSRSGGVSNCKKTKLVLSSDENQTLRLETPVLVNFPLATFLFFFLAVG
jgi:hypothetical protein